MAELITQSELARRCGKSQPYIGKLIKQGKLSMNEDKLLDYELCIKILNTSKNPSFDANREHAKKQKGIPLKERVKKAEDLNLKSTPKKETKSDALDDIDLDDFGNFENKSAFEINLLFNKAKTAEKIAVAKLRDIDVRLKEGELLEADIVKKEAAEVGNLVTQKLYNMVHKLAPLLVGIDSQKQTKDILENEVEIVLEELNRMSSEN